MTPSTRSRPKPLPSAHFSGIGTSWQLDLPTAVPERVLARVEDRVAQFDRDYSRFRSDSLVSRLAVHGGEVEFPADAPALFDLYDLLDSISDGAVTPLVGRSLEHLGYDREYSLRAQSGAVVPERW